MLKSNNKNPLFSIITPCFNSEKTIEDTFRSILEQNFFQVEYIVIDGGSNDSTLSIINRYILEFKKNLQSFKLVSEPDSGIYNAMNKGLSLVTGDYVLILNSDDYLLPDILNWLNAYIKQNDSPQLIAGDLLRLDARQLFRRAKARDSLAETFWLRMTIFHPSLFVSSTIYKQHSYDEKFRIVSDLKFVLTLMKLGYKFNIANKPFTVMRDGGVSWALRLRLLERFKVCRELKFNLLWIILSTLIKFLYSVLYSIKSKIVKVIYG